MLKNVDKINNYLNKWLRKNGFRCSVQMDNDFSFDIVNDVIHYSIIIPSSHNELFLKVCQECREEIVECDNFILSFFHELGHYETKDLFDDEWDEYDRSCEQLESKEEYTDEDYLNYYKYPLEIEATQWGCDYIVEHRRKVNNWWNGLSALIEEFVEVNNIELEEELNQKDI